MKARRQGILQRVLLKWDSESDAVLWAAVFRGWRELVEHVKTRRRHAARSFALRAGLAGGLKLCACWDAWRELVQDAARRKRAERQRARISQSILGMAEGQDAVLLRLSLGSWLRDASASLEAQRVVAREAERLELQKQGILQRVVIKLCSQSDGVFRALVPG